MEYFKKNMARFKKIKKNRIEKIQKFSKKIDKICKNSEKKISEN